MSQQAFFKKGVDTITGNIGGPISPDNNFNIDILGIGPILVTGTPATHSLDISLGGAVATEFDGDAGIAIPALGVLNINGAHNINTTGAGNTITVIGDNTITLGDLVPVVGDALTITTGDASIMAGHLNIAAGNINMADSDITGTEGYIFAGGVRFIGNYGANNNFIGRNSANLTLNPAAAIENVILGDLAFRNVTTGALNTGVGYGVLDRATTADVNCAFGGNVLGNLLTGANNIAIGVNAGINYVNNESDNILINSYGVVAENGTIRIGTFGDHTRCFINGIDGVNVGAVARVVTENAHQLGTAIITAGTGITITPAANTITIDSTVGAVTWTTIGASGPLVSNVGYICTAGAALVFTLPAVCPVGATVGLCLDGAVSWQITQAAGQQVRTGALQTTLGAGGSITGTVQGDTIVLVCSVANTRFITTSVIGNPAVI
jgi:hypothetical protein